MGREPLKAGAKITMPNNGKYVIEKFIGQGGLSLVYSAKTQNNGYPVIIKEFFPSEHARRALKTIKATDGTLIEKKGSVYPDDKRHSERFMRCYRAFELEGQLGSAARLNNFQVIAFSDCGSGYAVLPRWSNDTCSFEELEKGWRDAAPDKIDSVFTDLGRVRFALTAISSLLTALASLHAQDMLHLDISPSNVVWAGASRTSPENGMALLTDFGCSVLMSDGAYPVEYVLSYSEAFAAPEYKQKDGHLDRTSDIFSVGKLLIFLCCGQRAFDLHTNLRAEAGRLKISRRHREPLLAIMQKATAQEMDSRYQSATEMIAAVNDLLKKIPLYPINPDNSDSFTLYSLKSMLEGSMGTHHSWFHELCDHRDVNIAVPDFVFSPVCNGLGGSFTDDLDFLEKLLPQEVMECFQELNAAELDSQTVAAIMSCNYPEEWKRTISKMISNYGTNMRLPRLFANCRALLSSANLFRDDISLLFQLPGDDIAYFENCYTQCAYGDADNGFILLILFALLGQGDHGFMEFADQSPSDIYKMMLE